MVEIETLKRLSLQDNDIIVLKHPEMLSPQAIKNITKTLKIILDKIPQKNIQVVVLEEDMDVEVLGRDKEKEIIDVIVKNINNNNGDLVNAIKDCHN